MNVKISGSIIASLPEVGGVSQKGNAWRSKEYVLQTADKFPKKIAFSLRNENIDKFPLNIGDTIEADCDIDSREYNGRWYTSVSAWKISRGTTAAPTAPAPAAPAYQPTQPQPQPSMVDRMAQMYAPPAPAQPAQPTPMVDDLPF